MDYEKVNEILMKILEQKYGVKINAKVVLKESENKWIIKKNTKEQKQN